jgi:hypothetical protein
MFGVLSSDLPRTTAEPVFGDEFSTDFGGFFAPVSQGPFHVARVHVRTNDGAESADKGLLE